MPAQEPIPGQTPSRPEVASLERHHGSCGSEDDDGNQDEQVQRLEAAAEGVDPEGVVPGETGRTGSSQRTTSARELSRYATTAANAQAGHPAGEGAALLVEGALEHRVQRGRVVGVSAWSSAAS